VHNIGPGRWLGLLLIAHIRLKSHRFGFGRPARRRRDPRHETPAVRDSFRWPAIRGWEPAGAFRRCGDGAYIWRAEMDNVTETPTLIAGNKVRGANVYNPAGENLGDIYDVMIDKSSGRIIYALMSLGGILGLGRKLHPLPWSVLKYGPALGGYVVTLSKSQLEAAPNYPAEFPPDFSDRDQEAAVHRYYGVEPH
jgi:hypothetical protein